MLKPEPGQLLIHIPNSPDRQNDMAEVGRLVSALGVLIERDLRESGFNFRPSIRRAEPGSLDIVIQLVGYAAGGVQAASDLGAVIEAWNNLLGITASAGGIVALILARRTTKSDGRGEKLALETREAIGALQVSLNRIAPITPIKLSTSDQEVYLHELDVDRAISSVSPPPIMIEEDLVVEIVTVVDGTRIVLAPFGGRKIEAWVSAPNLRARMITDGPALEGYVMTCTVRRFQHFIPEQRAPAEIVRVHEILGWAEAAQRTTRLSAVASEG